MTEDIALLVSGITGFSIALGTLLLARLIGLRMLIKFAGDQQTSVAELFYLGLRWPSLVWCIATSLAIAVRVTELPERITSPISRGIEVFVIFSVTAATASMLNALCSYALRRVKSPLEGNGLLVGLIRTAVYISGGLVLLSQLGIAIGPLLTALGVGGLAVALAFKDTFENVFSGINLLVDNSIALGDRIKIEHNYEGLVLDIGWRTTKIRLDDGTLLIIPNTRLAQSVTLNRTKAAHPPQ